MDFPLSKASSGDKLLDTLLFDTNIVGIFIWDFDGRILQANDAFLRIVGYEREDLVAGMRWSDLTPPDLLDRQAERLREHIRTGRVQSFEKEYFRKDGTRVPVLVGVSRFEERGNQGVGFVLDVSEHKRAEAEHRAHVWFLESLDRIHRAIQGTSDLETMINAVLEEVRDIFQSDRALLSVFGTRSGTAWYKRLAIKLRPGCEHPDKVGVETVADEDSSAMRREVRAAGRPVQLVLGSVPAHVARVHARFGAQSVLSMAIEARHAGLEYDHFYYFTLDECSHRRVWTAEEMRLFEEIGRRLGDALTRLSTLGELQRRDAYLSEAQRLSHTASWAWNAARNEFVHWSRGRLPLLGPDSGEFPTFEKVRQSIHPEDRDAWSERFERAMRERSQFELEYRSELPDGRVKHFRTVAHPVLDGSGELLEFVGTVVDITAEKHAEAERRAHVWFLESMDRINRAMQGTNDLDQMMGDVLDAVLEVFAADRAWLLYPCDPDAPSWRPVMERTRPEFPGAAARGRDLPMTADSAEVARAALESRGALPAGPGHKRQVKPQIAGEFGVQSEMLMALRPKGDQPYLFGLHQCAQARSWTKEETRLFEEIGHRLTDALGSLTAFRSLRESERRLEAAQRLAHVGWWERHYATGHVSLSDEACRIFGVQPVDLPHWHGRWLSLIHSDDRHKAAEASDLALRGGARYDVEYRVVRPDGTVRMVHSQGDVMRDESGRAVRQFGVLQDVTELRQAEQEVRASEARFRTFVDHASDAFLLHDEQLSIVDVNRQACASLGYTREELIGMHPREFDTGLTEPAMMRLAQRVRGGETVTFETLHRRKDGSVFPVEIRARKFGQGDRRFVIALARDISERKLAEETLRGKDNALQIARTELARVSRVTTLGELTASIAHEVNQPLGAMVTSAAACSRWLAAQPPDMDEARTALDNIIADGKRAGEVIARIRALTRRQAPTMELLDVNRKVAEVVAFAEHELRTHDIVLRTELDSTLPRVAGDRVQLQQVLLNLIVNAIEAMSGVQGRPRELTIASARSDGKAIVVEVRDSGPGLEGVDAERVFEPFYTTKAQGIGIGLSISRSIVEAHGGRLWATANQPHGAVFRFMLPVAEEAAA